MDAPFDVEKMKKVNFLMRELRRTGMASSSDDAYNQAQEVFQPKQVEQDNGTVVLEEAPAQEQQETFAEPAPAEQSDYLAQKQFEILLEQNNKKYDTELDSLRSALDTLQAQFNQLQTEFHQLVEDRARKIVKVVEEKQETIKTEPQTVHPRRGNFNSNDVPIDKFFYFGKK